jgi:hypothetical protein
MRCFRCCCAARVRRTLTAVSSCGFAQVLREQLKDSELKSIFTDTNQVHKSRTPTAPLPSLHSLSRLQFFIHPPFSQTRDRTSAILDEHKDAQRQEKAADPTRFIPERKKSSISARWPHSKPPNAFRPRCSTWHCGVQAGSGSCHRPQDAGCSARFTEVHFPSQKPKFIKLMSDCREGASISSLNFSSSSAGMTSPSGAARDAAGSPGSAAQQSGNSFMSML